MQAVLSDLSREPLRNIVLLKHLLAYPDQVRTHRVAGPGGAATLVLLPAAAAPYDQQAYPWAAVIALIGSDHPDLTAALLPAVPRDVGVVFKIASDDDLPPIQRRFDVARRAALLSFTAEARGLPDPAVRITAMLADAAFDLFRTQDHARTWLEPLLRQGKAFACILGPDGAPRAACFAFENYASVWEIGGVVTDPAWRRQGLGARVVRSALAVLGARGLSPRYQVDETNQASIALARSAGLRHFLTITHYAHAC